jgi:hypothetical protein
MNRSHGQSISRRQSRLIISSLDCNLTHRQWRCANGHHTSSPALPRTPCEADLPHLDEIAISLGRDCNLTHRQWRCANGHHTSSPALPRTPCEADLPHLDEIAISLGRDCNLTHRQWRCANRRAPHKLSSTDWCDEHASLSQPSTCHKSRVKGVSRPGRGAQVASSRRVRAGLCHLGL